MINNAIAHRRLENDRLGAPSDWRYWGILPNVGVGAVIIGTAFSLMLTPVNVELKGALFWPALILAVSIVLAPGLAVLQNARSAFHPIHIVLLAPIYWLLLDPIQGIYGLEGVTQESARQALAAIGGFCLAVWMATFQQARNLPGPIRAAMEFNPTSETLFRIALCAFALAFLRFAIPAKFNPNEMVRAFYGGRWSAPWGRGALGGWNAFIDHLVYFGYLLPGLTALIARKRGWKDLHTVLCGGLTLVILLLTMVDGGRRIIGVMAGVGLLTWFLSGKDFRTRHLVQIGVVSVLVLVVLQLIIDYRNIGMAGILGETQDIVDAKYMRSAGIQQEKSSNPRIQVDDNFYRLCQVIQIIPDEHPHVTWRWMLWVAVRPVPRVFWSGKPVDPGFDLPAHLGMKGVSLSLSLIGEAYMAFGFVGVVICGWIIGRVATNLAKVIENRRNTGAIMLFGCGTMALFTGMRSGIELVLMSYISLAWIGFVWTFHARPVGIRKHLGNAVDLPATVQTPPCESEENTRYDS
jgi:hypothetical protein